MKAPKKMKFMGRSPADHAAAGRQDIWLALKRQPQNIQVADLVAQTKLARSSVSRYLQALTAGGYLEHVPAPAGSAAHWVLLKDVGYHAPRLRRDGTPVTQGEITGQLWIAMCGLKDFDFRELQHNASIEIPEATAKDYCKRLLAAGYLRVLSKADPSTSQIARYRLVRNSGPAAPQIQRVQQVYDPNTGDVYPMDGRS